MVVDVVSKLATKFCYLCWQVRNAEILQRVLQPLQPVLKGAYTTGRTAGLIEGSADVIRGPVESGTHIPARTVGQLSQLLLDAWS